MVSIMNEIKEATVSGNLEEVIAGIDRAITENVSVEEIIQNGLIDAMAVVGGRFSNNEIFVPEMLIAARAMKGGIEKLRPLMVGKEMKTIATVVIGSVKGDLHDIGKNLVAIMLDGSGFKVIDIGVDISIEKFISAVNIHKPQFLGLSALLTTTMAAMRETVDAFKRDKAHKSLRIIVGGAPVTQNFSDDIGADAYAENAATAVDKLKEMLNQRCQR